MDSFYGGYTIQAQGAAGVGGPTGADAVGGKSGGMDTGQGSGGGIPVQDEGNETHDDETVVAPGVVQVQASDDEGDEQAD